MNGGGGELGARVLLVEDSAAEADLVREYLEDRALGVYAIVHVRRLGEAVEKLQSLDVDVVLLDLQLPDSSGVDSVRQVRRHAGTTPIVVLTGTNDDRLALECIDAGAQDYLSKDEVQSKTIRRAIGYALTRRREAQLSALKQLLDGYRAMSSATSPTSVTAAIAGSGAVSLRNPAVFESLVRDYVEVLRPLVVPVSPASSNRDELERIVTILGDATGGPRDLIDVHVAALERLTKEQGVYSGSTAMEGRLVALEMMGLLVDYYRVGYRRRTRGS